MREFSQEFSAHINGEATTLCWVWKLTRSDNVVLGFTDHDNDLEIDGVFYMAASGFSPSDIEGRLGYSLDNSAVQGLLSSERISSEDLRSGLYNSAGVEISRVNWQNIAERALIWAGHIGKVSVDNDHFEAELVGRSAKLNRSTGRVFSRLCGADFGDGHCGIDAAAYPEGTQCPKTFAACSGQFDNAVSYRGFPYLIGDDAVYAGIGEADLKDGSSRYKI